MFLKIFIAGGFFVGHVALVSILAFPYDPVEIAGFCSLGLVSLVAVWTPFISSSAADPFAGYFLLKTFDFALQFHYFFLVSVFKFFKRELLTLECFVQLSE